MLSRDELRRTRLDTTQDRAVIAQVPSAPTSSGVAAPAAAQPVSDDARRDGNPLGWVMAERAGASALVRRHPLTVEGERIGAFEVALGCGQALGTYAVTYAETRRNADERDAAAVKRVDLWIEGKTALLDVVSSHAGAAPREIETLASGTVSADLVKSFADATGDSMTVRTVSGGNPGTLIRVGNSGFARAFSQLAAACDAGTVRTETRAELNPVGGEGPRTP